LAGLATPLAAAVLILGGPMGAAAPVTVTPIKHLIVGASPICSGSTNRRRGLLSITYSPGQNFANAARRQAEVHDLYDVTPQTVGNHDVLLRPETTFARGPPRNVPDQRFPELLPNGPSPITKYHQGAVAKSFYNIAAGDTAYIDELADTYALSDNHHLPVTGGTDADIRALATGHAMPVGRQCTGQAAAKPDRQHEPGARHQ
jgi:hypothetical protein